MRRSLRFVFLVAFTAVSIRLAREGYPVVGVMLGQLALAAWASSWLGDFGKSDS